MREQESWNLNPPLSHVLQTQDSLNKVSFLQLFDLAANIGARNPSYLKLPKLKALEDEPELRLVGGSGRCSGHMEILHQGAWGTMCNDLRDLKEAGVMCWQLGYGWAIAAPGKAHFGPGSGGILLDSFQCSGNESHLGQCPSSGWSDHKCGHHEDAGVICSDTSPSPPGAGFFRSFSSYGMVEGVHRAGLVPWQKVSLQPG